MTCWLNADVSPLVEPSLMNDYFCPFNTHVTVLLYEETFSLLIFLGDSLKPTGEENLPAMLEVSRDCHPIRALKHNSQC